MLILSSEAAAPSLHRGEWAAEQMPAQFVLEVDAFPDSCVREILIFFLFLLLSAGVPREKQVHCCTRYSFDYSHCSVRDGWAGSLCSVPL